MNHDPRQERWNERNKDRVPDYCDEHNYDFVFGVSNDGRCPWCIIDALEDESKELREAAQAYLDNRTGGRDRLVALLRARHEG